MISVGNSLISPLIHVLWVIIVILITFKFFHEISSAVAAAVNGLNTVKKLAGTHTLATLMLSRYFV